MVQIDAIIIHRDDNRSVPSRRLPRTEGSKVCTGERSRVLRSIIEVPLILKVWSLVRFVTRRRGESRARRSVLRTEVEHLPRWHHRSQSGRGNAFKPTHRADKFNFFELQRCFDGLDLAWVFERHNKLIGDTGLATGRV